MATLAQIEQALRAADAAGNVEDAKALAAEYARLRDEATLAEGQQSGKLSLQMSEQLSPEDRAAIAQDYRAEMAKQPPVAMPTPSIDPTEGNSFLENAAIGAGKSVYDTGRSLGQIARDVMPDKAADAMGLPTQADIDEAKRLDQAIMQTGGGNVGNLAGAIAQTFIPGTGQLKAAKGIGELWSMGGALNKAKAIAGAGGLGALQAAAMNPRGSDDSLTGQLALGGAMGAGGQLAGAGLSAGIQGVRNVMAGQQGSTGRILSAAGQQSPGELADTIRAGNTTLISGSNPTTAQAAQNGGISQLERTVRTLGYNGLLDNDALQNAARLQALENVPGVGPLAMTSNDAAENAGAIIRQQYDQGRNAIKREVSDKFNDPRLQSLSFTMPKDRIQAAIEQYYPGGTFSEAPAMLRKLTDGETDVVSHPELQSWRSLTGEMARDKFNTDVRGRAAALAVKGVLSDVYDQAIQAGKDKLSVTGDGAFGPQYGNLAGDSQNAIAHLLQTGQGEVPSAATNPMAGDISLVAGAPVKKGHGAYGLLHVDAHGRNDVLNRLSGLLSEGVPYSRLINSGDALIPKSAKGRFLLGDGDYEALIRNDFNNDPSNAWNHTAYKVYDGEKLPVGTIKSTKADSFTPSAQFQKGTTGNETIAQDPRMYRDLMPEEAAQVLQEGRKLRQLQKDRFETGPGFSMTQKGRDGVAALNGAEVPKAWFNAKDSQAADMAQFAKTLPDNDEAWQALRRYALSDLKQQASNTDGSLSNAKFQKWLQSRDGALKGLLSSDQADAVNAVSKDLARATSAENLGRVKGPDTAQKLMGVGLLDSPLANLLFNKIPLTNQLTGPILTTLRDAQRRQLAQQVGQSLVDPEDALKALERYQALQKLTGAQRGILDYSPLFGGAIGGSLQAR